MSRLLRSMWKQVTSFLPNRRQSRRASPRPRARLWLEMLEDRSVPAATNFSSVVTGTAFIDGNGNGTFDANEAGIPGVVVTLKGTTNLGSPITANTQSDANGAFTFDNVLPGQYQVSADAVPGVLGGGVIADVVVPEGQTVIRNLAFQGPDPASISMRQFSASTTIADFPYDPAGTGQALANDRPDTRPTVSSSTTVFVARNQLSTRVDLAGFFFDPDLVDSVTRLKFVTSRGGVTADMIVDLFADEAPQTVANFLNYVNADKYDNSIFDRLVPGFVLQGGSFTFASANNQSSLTAIDRDPAVENEFDVSRSNVAGTIAMAKRDTDPNSATDAFFFNLVDNSNNLNEQNEGFTVFGKVADSSRGVLTNLSNTTGNPPISIVNQTSRGFSNTFPLINYGGSNFPTDTAETNLLMVKDIVIEQQDEFLTYGVVADSNTNTGLLTAATVQNNRLLLTTADATGTGDIGVRATDRFGATLEATFHVQVIDAPTTGVSLDTTTPTATATLTATATPATTSGQPVTLTYVWSINGNVVQTTTKTDTTDTLNLAAEGAAVGQTVVVTVTPRVGLAVGSVATASATVTA